MEELHIYLWELVCDDAKWSKAGILGQYRTKCSGRCFTLSNGQRS